MIPDLGKCLNQFSDKVVYQYNLKKNLNVSSQKNGFPILLSKSDLGGVGGQFFLPKKFIWKSQTPWNMPKF